MSYLFLQSSGLLTAQSLWLREVRTLLKFSGSCRRPITLAAPVISDLHERDNGVYPASVCTEADHAGDFSSGKKLMLSRRLTLGAALGTLIVSLQGGAAQAQFFDNCGCNAVAAAPIAHCTPIQPVQATCYQTVPVTTYTRERQTVEVPTYETTYEDREVTVYRPVTRSREVEVPTVSYQNVTEYRTVNRDMGRWVTNYHPIARCAPCQVDPRPGVIGWMNRTGYSMRTAFTPNYTTSRQYVPNMVTCSVPQTRQVAVQGTRRVTVQDTEMVAERKTERYPVQKLVMKKEEVTVMKPQTAYRTVPIGTTMAYGAPFIGGTQMAYGGYIIDNTASRSALAPQPDPISGRREALRSDDAENREFKRSANEGTNLRGSSSSRPFIEDDELGFPPSTSLRPESSGNTPRSESVVVPATLRTEQAIETAAAKPVSLQSGWRSARRTTDRSVSDSRLSSSAISLSDATREK